MTVRFGPFELHAQAGELRKHGVRLALQEQPLLVLEALVEYPGELVSRDALVARLWPEGVHVDFERGLNVAVARLRQALGDSADSPRYIETVPRRGYRFIGQLEKEPAPVPPDVAAPARVVYPRAFWILGGLLAMLLATAATLVRGRSTPSPLTGTAAAPIPLTSFPGHEFRASLSPDGRYLAFDWDQTPREHRIYIKLTNGGDPARLTSANATEFNPAWSPDGREIAFYRAESPKGVGVYIVPAVGGVERKVFGFSPWWQLDLSRTVTTGLLAWTPDGKGLIITAAPEDAGMSFLYLSLESGKHRWLIPPEGDAWALHPTLSPDGRTLAFVRNGGLMAGDVYVAPFSQPEMSIGQPRRITRFNSMMGGIAWLPDGRGLVFSAGNNAQMNLYRLDINNATEPVPLYFAGHAATQPVVTRHGALVYTRRIQDFNIRRQEIPSVPGTLPPSTQLIASTELDTSGRYSPDGKRIAFKSTRSGTYQLWICDAPDGQRCMQVTHEFSGRHVGDPSWSPDGRHLVFDAAESGNFDVWVVSSSGGKARRITDHPADDCCATSSRDGRYIYFQSIRSGAKEVWRLPSDGGEPVRITTGGGARAVESADGEWLVYSRPTRAGKRFESLWKKPLRTGGADVQLVDSIYLGQWAVAKDRLWYKAPAPSGPELRYRNTLTGADVFVGRVPPPASPERPLSISPDGKYLLYTENDNSGTDLMITRLVQ